MSRAGSARRSDGDDIPVATRTSPRRSPKSVDFKFLASLAILSFAAIFIFAIFISPQIFSSDKNSSQLASDGRLLGHFPYEEVSNEDLIEVYPGLLLHREAYSSLAVMREAAAQQGIRLVLLSGFRSIDLQREIFYENKSIRNQIALERARVSAPPGYSEHSTGYAIDFGDPERRETDFEETFESTKAFRWLQANAARYHFVLSFPKGNPQGVNYEPWHWRYEGTVEALEEFRQANEFQRTQRP